MTLDRRITLYAPTTSQNNSGQVKLTFVSQGEFYAMEILAETGNIGTESFVNDQMTSSYISNFRLRYQTEITADWKIQYNSKFYDIISVVPEGRKRFILVKTKLRDNGTL